MSKFKVGDWVRVLHVPKGSLPPCTLGKKGQVLAVYPPTGRPTWMEPGERLPDPVLATYKIKIETQHPDEGKEYGAYEDELESA